MRRKFIQIESKNAILELLKEGRKFTRIFMAQNAFKDSKTDEILKEAKAREIPIEVVSRRIVNRRSKTSSTESVVALMEPTNSWDMKDLLEDIYSRHDDPFFLIFDNVKYGQNVATIMRTAFAAFVNGIVTPIKKENLLSDEIIRISMGASERIPIVEMNLFAAIKELQKNGVKVITLDMEGETYFQADLTGPIAIVMGAEDMGVSDKITERADGKISIPMKAGIGSLNVGASAAIVMYEKIRQEAQKAANQ